MNGVNDSITANKKTAAAMSDDVTYYNPMGNRKYM